MILKQTIRATPSIMILMLSVLASAQGSQLVTVAFVNANVIPLDHEGVEVGRTVVVRGDRIAAIGRRSEVKVPPDAVTIDCIGAYLVPGLTDAHVHVSGSPAVPTRDDFGDALIYLAYGVTTVVNLSGSPTILDWRKRIEAGTLLGPTLYASGPFVNEPRVNTPDEVESDILAQAQLGYDLIRFHELFRTTTGLSLPAYRRMIEVARRIRMPLIGHAPVNLGIGEMLRAQQSIAHLGMLSNIYFLPLSSHMAILLVTAGATLILICITLASVISAVIRRFSKRVPRQESRPGTINKLAGLVALTAAGAFACAFAFLPGGPLFDSTLLRVVVSALTGIVTIGTLVAGFLVLRHLREGGGSMLGNMAALLVVTSAGALTAVMLIFWVPISWRSSDGGMERVAKWVHDSGIFVQSTLVAYDTFSTSGRTALIGDSAVDFLMPSIRKAWRQEPKRGIPLNQFTAFVKRQIKCEWARHIIWEWPETPPGTIAKTGFRRVWICVS